MTSNAMEKPIVVDAADEVNWDDTADVVVVGYGAAGACSAIEAREQGADVLIIDRFGGGGATAYSGGIIYAGNTRQLRAAGYEDSPENMYDYLSREVGDAMSEETLRRFCAESGPNMEWLEKQGLVYTSAVFTGKTTYPPADAYLYFSGQEKVPRFAEHAKPVPRGHRTFGEGWTGNAFYRGLKNSAERLGVRRRFHTIATRLVVDGENRVIGIEVNSLPADRHQAHQEYYDAVKPTHPFAFDKVKMITEECKRLEDTTSERQLIRARKGVILSTGGFTYNVSMLERYMPIVARNAPCLIRFGSLGCDGSGIRLVQSVNGALSKMDNPFIGRTLARPDQLCYGIAVNKQGKRFINEDAYVSVLGKAIYQQEEARSWLIMDGGSWRQVLRHLIPIGDSRGFTVAYLTVVLSVLFGGTRRATSLPALAGKCGIDPDGLVSQVEAFNSAIENREPDEFGKLDEYIRPVSGKSYYAINIGMPNKLGFMVFFSLGGAVVDEDTGGVMDTEGNAIPGLFAAGRTAIGLCSNDYFASGSSLADCIFSGRRAGRSCARI